MERIALPLLLIDTSCYKQVSRAVRHSLLPVGLVVLVNRQKNFASEGICANAKRMSTDPFHAFRLTVEFWSC
jgi:hypothetical protein